jgi:hypothetical protein
VALAIVLYLRLSAIDRGSSPIQSALRCTMSKLPLSLARVAAVALAALSLQALTPAVAQACGGCFVPPPPPQTVFSPIVQEAERILFVRDTATGKSTIWIEIRYNGAASDFGWVLPLPKAPEKVGVGTSYLFDRLHLATGPQFRLDSGPAENCSADGGGVGCAASDDSARAGALVENRSPDTDDVTVLAHDQIGPYDYQVISGTTAADIQAWLSKNGFAMPQSAGPVLEDHVKNGFVFVAVKLAAGKSAKEIQPIALTLPQVEPCVPLRLTAIAAVEDTLVEVHVAGPGRAVPKNHLHVQLNPLRLNWFDGGSNYGQLLAAAMDEAAGRAFVTQFAAAPPKTVTVQRFSRFGFAGTEQQDLVPAAALDVSAIADQTTTCAALNLLKTRGFPITAETAAILQSHMGLATGTEADKLAEFYQNLDCAAPQAMDGKALREHLDEAFSAPLRNVLPLLQGQQKLTRMAMRISPSEMTKDPVFAFHPNLPDVDREWRAVSNIVCSSDGFTASRYRLTLPGQGSWLFDAPATGEGVPQQFGPDLPITSSDPRMTATPAAAVIELLDEQGPPRPIAPAQIDLVDSAIAAAKEGGPQLPNGLVLQATGQRVTVPPSDARVATKESADACTGGRRPAAMTGWLLALAGVTVALRRRRLANLFKA